MSLWNEVAHAQEGVHSLWKTTLPVVGFTALRTKTFKGTELYRKYILHSITVYGIYYIAVYIINYSFLPRFTLSSTMSTSLILDPDGPKGKTMYTWYVDSKRKY